MRNSDFESIAERLKLAVVGDQGSLLDSEGTPAEFTFRANRIGNIHLPTGRLCVTDAYSADHYPPINRIVKSGSFGVEAVLADSVNGAGLNDWVAFLWCGFPLNESLRGNWRPPSMGQRPAFLTTVPT